MGSSSGSDSILVAARRFSALLLLLITAGCGDEPRPQITEPGVQLSSSAFPAPLECPANQAVTATATIGAAGGSVSAGGHRVTLPVGAVRRPTSITVSAPASNYMELDITANGRDDFTFRAPVRITISYDRCTRSNIEKGPLGAWFWDPETKTLLEVMDATDDRDNRRIEFPTDHLSGYVVAN